MDAANKLPKKKSRKNILMKTLKDFAKYLRENRLRDFAIYYICTITGMDIPLIKLVIKKGLVKDPSGEVSIIRTMESQEKFFQSLEDDTAIDRANENLKIWKEDKLPGISRNEIVPSDLILLYAAQKKSISHFLPDFTKDSTEAISIIQEIDDFYTEGKKNAIQMLFEMQMSSESKFKGLLESAPDAMVIVNNDGKIQLINAQTENLFGYKREEIIGKEVELLIPDRFKRIYHSHRKGFFIEPKIRAMAVGLELYGRKKDGNEFPVEISLSPIETEEGILVSAAIRDITNQKKASEELKATNYFLDLVLENIPNMLFVKDARDLKFVRFNKAGEELLGYTNEELIGKNNADFFPETEADFFTAKDREVLSQTNVIDIPEEPITTKSGEVRWLHTKKIPILEPSGKPLYLLGISEDITEELQKTEMEKLAIAATKSFNSVIITNEHGIIEWVNEGFTSLTGYSLDEVKGTHGESLRRGADTGISEGTGYYKSVIQGKVPITYESKNYSKQGRAYWTITTLTPVLDKNGQVKRIIAIDSDITLGKQMEENLVNANKAAEDALNKGNEAIEELMKAKKELEESMSVKEQFLANMSHEIRTPMNAIVGFTDLALKTPLSPEQKQYIDAIKTSGENLIVIINDILDFSKIQSGKISFEQIEFSISQVVSTITELMLPKSVEKNIKLSKSIAKGVPERLIGDPTRLSQILLNLVGNAIKFTEKGEIKINIEQIAEKKDTVNLKFTISDTGIGIPKEKLPNIFDAFTQATYDTNRKYGGTGLGLAIVKQLVGLLGGDIKVTSKLKKGSVFTFNLTYRKNLNPEPAPKVNLNENVFTGINDLNVLLVEDNVLNQILAQKVLSDWGWKVELADNGLSAVEKIEKQNFDMVLMDIQMPEMDGYEATHYIREKMPLPKSAIPIIAMTAHALSGEEEKCLKAGMNGYVSKPFNPQKLYQKINSVLNMNNNVVNQGGEENHDEKNNTSHKHTDLTYLRGIANGSDAFIIQMLGIFIEQTPQTLVHMEKALKNKDWKSLRLIVHKMKPSIMFTGLGEIINDVPLLEKYAAEESHLDDIPALIDKIKKACNEAMVELKEEVEKLRKS